MYLSGFVWSRTLPAIPAVRRRALAGVSVPDHAVMEHVCKRDSRSLSWLDAAFYHQCPDSVSLRHQRTRLSNLDDVILHVPHAGSVFRNLRNNKLCFKTPAPPPRARCPNLFHCCMQIFGRDDCNAEDSCVFIGRSITGACVPRDPSIFHKVCVFRAMASIADDEGRAYVRALCTRPALLVVKQRAMRCDAGQQC